ncbi:MAG: cation-translocating P-type ATPase [Oligoflexia bacterium]
MDSSVQGLTQAEVTQRLREFGFNELPATGRTSVLKILFRVLREPMLLLLLACGGIYVFSGEPSDGVLLFASALIVVAITLYQEVKSERALEALRELSSPRALVVRDGKLQRIPGREVVPGDLLQVAEGDRVPADATLLSTTHLGVDESLLTGESFAVMKSAGSGLFSGTLVVAGQALATVTATGPRTEMGRIGKSLSDAPEAPTQLQVEINRIIKVTGVLGALFSAAIAVVYGVSRSDWLGGVLAGLAAAMSLLPEELPVVMTVFLAMGAWRISRSRVLTRRVAAIEALGSISALCVDKTGTLTENRMAVRDVECAAGRAELLRNAAMACHENPFDPMEIAIVRAAAAAAGQTSFVSGGVRLRTYPLSSGLMAMSCAWKTDAGVAISAKGAPEAIVQLCHLDANEARKVLASVHRFASQGMRVLAVAMADLPGGAGPDLPEHQHEIDFKYVGLLTLEDPIRSDVPAAVAECRGAGIRVIMLTGDYPETARSIAGALGLSIPEGAGGTVLTGRELSALDDLALCEVVRTTSVFARVTPEQKLRIVMALRGIGERVAMTGDGVNDAPSLKWANIGVAMGGRGTDVAREAAAIVLLDDSFSSMAAAIRLGRRIYDNLQRAVLFILSVHVPIAGLAMLPVLFNLPLLLLPVHIVFLELIIDPACTLVYEAEEAGPELMKRPPRTAAARLVGSRDLGMAILRGGVGLLLVLGVYVGLLRTGHGVDEARTAAYVALILSNLGLIVVSRERTASGSDGAWGTLGRALRAPNAAFRWVILLALGFLLVAIGIAPVRELFSFAPLGALDLGLAFGAGLLSVLLSHLLFRPPSQSPKAS